LFSILIIIGITLTAVKKVIAMAPTVMIKNTFLFADIFSSADSIKKLANLVG